MKIARRALADPDRKIELEEELDERVAELLEEASGAGYRRNEAIDALMSVAQGLREIRRRPQG